MYVFMVVWCLLVFVVLMLGGANVASSRGVMWCATIQ